MENLDMNPKITAMLSLLTKERQDEAFATVIEVLSKFRKTGKLKPSEVYPFELTLAFDQEEPTQFLYLKCSFSVVEQVVGENDNIPQTVLSTKLNMEDAEVFNQDAMFTWLDHVNRIEKSSKLENSIFNENTIFNKDKKDRTAQSNIRKSITVKDPNSVFNQKNNPPKDFFKKIGKDHNPEDAIITNFPSSTEDDDVNDMFDFYNETAPILSEEEYLDIFRQYCKNAINTVTEGFMIPEYFENGITRDDLIDNMKDLQEYFSNCDFWQFKLETLQEFGFINFANKLMLIPMWAFPIITINGMGRLVGKKDGTNFEIKEDFNDWDFENSYGCYGTGILTNSLNLN